MTNTRIATEHIGTALALPGIEVDWSGFYASDVIIPLPGLSFEAPAVLD